MKNNLKTVPSKDGVDAVEWCIQMGDWLDAFEKELRQRLKLVSRWKEINEADRRLYWFIESILEDAV